MRVGFGGIYHGGEVHYTSPEMSRWCYSAEVARVVKISDAMGSSSIGLVG